MLARLSSAQSRGPNALDPRSSHRASPRWRTLYVKRQNLCLPATPSSAHYEQNPGRISTPSASMEPMSQDEPPHARPIAEVLHSVYLSSRAGAVANRASIITHPVVVVDSLPPPRRQSCLRKPRFRSPTPRLSPRLTPDTCPLTFGGFPRGPL